MNKKTIFPFLLVFFEMLTYLSSDMFLPSLPSVMHDLGLNHQSVQLTLTSWFLGAISVQLVLGPLSDRLGRKHVLCFGGILFILSTFACAFSPNFHVLLIARFFQGTGVSFMAVPGYASIHELYEQKRAIQLLALMGSIAVLAPALGPLAGSVILVLGDWRDIFFTIGVLAVVAVGLLIMFMPETLLAENRHPLAVHKILSIYWRILSNRRFMLTGFTMGLLFCGFITWIVAGPLLSIDHFHYSPVMFRFPKPPSPK